MSSENEGTHLLPKKRRPERRHDQQNNKQACTDPKPDQRRDHQLPPNDVNSESRTRELTQRYKEQQEGGDNGSNQHTSYSNRYAAKKQGGEGRKKSPIRSSKVSKNTEANGNENQGSSLFQRRSTHNDVECKNLHMDSSGSGESYKSEDDSNGSDQSYKPERVTQSTKPVKSCKSAKPVKGCRSGGDGGWKGKAPMDGYEGKGVTRAKGNPGKLLFGKCLSSNDVKSPYIIIPRKDGETYFPSLTTPEGNYQKKILQIFDDQNTKWEMTLVRSSKTCDIKRIYGDWSKFVQEHHLKANDKVVFYKTKPSNENSYFIRIKRTNEAATGPEDNCGDDNDDGDDDSKNGGRGGDKNRNFDLNCLPEP